MKLANTCITIDIDIIDDKGRVITENLIDLVKAFYSFSWIKRIIVKTKHGYHVYFPTLKVKDFDSMIRIRAILGDHRKRILYEEIMRKRNLYMNVLFHTTELYEVKANV
ncbi:MAG: hypothetical protein B6U76_06545 [Desulfurococcales archaeon ex4484_217_2]|nr:MAG: hypothetical protein B6U76_06545 [Desulfurococcales archaeon ex4484_217_2]